MAELNIRKPLRSVTTQPAATFKTSRRKFMFLSAAAAASLPACVQPASEESVLFAAWPSVDIPEVTAEGYGWHFDYFELTDGGLWPRILSELQKKQLSKLSDLILPGTETAPAPSELGVAEFWDEWVSAPYSPQARTREMVFNGLAWIERQYQKKYGIDFLTGSAQNDKDFMESWSTISEDDEALSKLRSFFEHMRYLTLGAYYTTPEGALDLGAVLNVPITGDYPGPSPEAQAHLDKVLKDAGLSL